MGWDEICCAPKCIVVPNVLRPTYCAPLGLTYCAPIGANVLRPVGAIVLGLMYCVAMVCVEGGGLECGFFLFFALVGADFPFVKGVGGFHQLGNLVDQFVLRTIL